MSFRESIRASYEKYGVANYYQNYGNTYANPHADSITELLETTILQWNLDLNHVLDLAAGAGEVTKVLQNFGKGIQATDPFTSQIYQKQTGRNILAYGFEDIATGKAIEILENEYSLIICSYAMHLIEPSWLPRLLCQLKQISPSLLIISPHKRPVIKPDTGWELSKAVITNRVHARLYH